MSIDEFSLPRRELLEYQSARLSGLRARLLRRAQIALRRRILDLGCGYGSVTSELVRRGGGQVVALDRQLRALTEIPEAFAGAHRICGDAGRLPFADAKFDLVFSQFSLLWMDLAAALAEIHRILTAGGIFAAIEPDYGGMIESPDSIRTQPLWMAGLSGAGADPCVGRRLPMELANRGFDVHVELVPELDPHEEARTDLLRGLPLSDEQRKGVDRIEQAARERQAPWSRVIHLPLFLIMARR